MVGMLGVANRPGGYDDKLVKALDPLLQTCANAIFTLRADLRQKSVEARLRNEQSRIRGMLEGVFDGIVTIDEKGNIESLPRSSRLVGREFAEAACLFDSANGHCHSSETVLSNAMTSRASSATPARLRNDRDLFRPRVSGHAFNTASFATAALLSPLQCRTRGIEEKKSTPECVLSAGITRAEADGHSRFR